MSSDKKMQMSNLAPEFETEILNPYDLRGELCAILRSMDFRHSHLPKEDLERKRDPAKQPCGDFEYGVRCAIRDLQKPGSDKSYIPHIEDFDRGFGQILIKYKDAIGSGSRGGAYEGAAALVKCFRLRSSFPSQGSECLQKDHFLDYMQQCCIYLKDYLTLLDAVAILELRLNDLKQLHTQYVTMEKQVQEGYDRFQKELLANEAMREDCKAITLANTSHQLTLEQQALLTRSIDLGVEKALCDMRKEVYHRSHDYVNSLRLQVEALRIPISKTPVLALQKNNTGAQKETTPRMD